MQARNNESQTPGAERARARRAASRVQAILATGNKDKARSSRTAVQEPDDDPRLPIDRFVPLTQAQLGKMGAPEAKGTSDLTSALGGKAAEIVVVDTRRGGVAAADPQPAQPAPPPIPPGA